MGKELKKIGNTGVMINKNWKRGDHPAFDKVLSDILNNRLKVKLEESDKKKKNKKTKNLKIKKGKTT